MPRITYIAAATVLVAATVAAHTMAGAPGERPQDRQTTPERTLQLHVYPTVARAPAEVRIEAVIARSDENRRLEVTVDSEGYYRSSSVELDGARAARIYTVAFRGLPEGTFEVTVRSSGDQEVRPEQQSTTR